MAEADALIRISCGGLTMADNWKSYLCNVNDNIASIFVNVALREDVPIVSKPWLLWVWVYFHSPRPDGLSDSNEAPTLFKIEDALATQLSRQSSAILCGRITTQGRREFYFYGETKDNFPEAVVIALTAFDGYKFDTGEQEDSIWEQYLNVLYPSPEQFERIKNREVLEVLAEHGDVAGVSREVQHWMYFKTEQSRALFKDAVIKVGYSVVSESCFDEEEMPFGITVMSSQPVEQNMMDTTVGKLVQLTIQFEGEYDGWETQVITQ